MSARYRLIARYTVAVVASTAAFMIRLWIIRSIGGELPHYVTFYPAVMLVALWVGLGPGLVATAIAAAIADYWILEPTGWGISNLNDAVGLALFAGMGVFMSVVAGRYRRASRHMEGLVAQRTAEAARVNEQLLREIQERKIVQETLRVLNAGLEQRVATQTEAIRRANETLELRITERTAELQAANESLRASRAAALNLMEDAVEARRQAENEKNRLAAVMETLPVGVAIVDAQGGNIRSNAAFEAVWGGPHPVTDAVADYVAYKAWWADTGKPVQPEEWAAAVAVQKGDTVVGQTMQIQRFDGKRTFILNSAAPIRDTQGGIIGAAVAIMDITERKQAETELRRQKAFADSVIDTLPGVFYLFDAQGRLLRWNRNFELVTGYSPQELADMAPWDFFRGADRDRIRLAVQKVFETGETTIEADFVSKDDRGRPYLFTGTLVELADEQCLTGMGIDISERRQAVEELRRQTARLDEQRRIADLASLFVRDMQGPIIYWNTGARQLYGFTEEEAVGRVSHELLQTVFPEPFEHVEAKLLAEGRWEGELIHTRRDGTKVTVFSYWVVHRDEQGRPHAVLEVNNDITATKEAERALRESTERFQLLSEVAGRLLQTDDPQALVEALCRKVMEHLDCHVFVNFLIDEEAHRLHLNASAGMPDKTVKAIEWLDFGQAICGRVAQEGKRIVAENIQESCDARADLVRSFGIKAYACHPITALNRVIGTLSFGTRSRKTFSEDDLALMKTVTDQVATAMERMRAQRALQEANEQLEHRVQERTAELRRASAYNRSLIEASLDPLVTIDADGKVTDVNAGTEKATGRARDELIGTDFSNYFTEPEKARAGYQQVFREGWVQDYALELRHRDGHLTPVLYNASVYRDAQGEVLGVFAAARDITERKRAEEAVKLERQRLHELFEMLPVYVALLTPDYHIPYANRTFRERFGEANDRRCYEHLFDRAVPCENCETFKVLEGNQPRTWEWTGPDGRDYDIFDFPFTDSDGSPMIMEMGIDVTEQKRLQRELRQMNEELEQRVAARTAELQTSNQELEAFAYSVSHDLRAPLRAMDGFSQALLEDYADALDDEGKSHLRRVRAASQRMGDLIDGILGLSRTTRSEVRRTAVNMSDVARAVAAELQKADPQRQAEFVIEPRLIVNADANLLRIMLENLLGNAWKFTSKHAGARIEVGELQHEGETAYFVRDDGAGFDMAHAKNMFRAFQRLHSTSEFDGTGVGLATVQRIVLRHGGRVWAEGQVEKGATFYFTLPANEERR